MKVSAPMLAGLALLGLAPAAHACRYCQQAADPVEAMRFQGPGRKAAAGGSFPLDDALNTYQNGAPLPAPAVVHATAEPPVVRPVAVEVAAPAAAPVSPRPPVAVAAPAPPRPQSPASARWADLGLLGLAGLGGWFAWKTRAASAA